jgi:hypothetical protein
VHSAWDVVLVILGVLATIIVLDAAIRTFVVPRGTFVTFTYVVFRGVRMVLGVFASPRRGWEPRDRVMAVYAPLALLALPAISLLVVFGAYAAIFQGIENHGWRSAFITSGSSLLTLGFEKPPDLASTFVAFTEASIGLAILALLIAYLPAIYNGFSRREIAVTDLEVRAGTPPLPAELLLRAHRTGFLDQLDPFWETWMAWFTEVRETHTSFAALPFFRSPHPHRSWITAAGAVLDTAALRLSIIDIPWTPQAPLCIRSGYLMLREVAGYFGFDYDDDPAPDDPISIARDEFDEVYDRLAAAGLPMVSDREQGWKDFVGWRVNYDPVLLALAALIIAPYAPWVSDRSPRRALRRYEIGPGRRAMSRRTASGPRKDPR